MPSPPSISSLKTVTSSHSEPGSIPRVYHSDDRRFGLHAQWQKCTGVLITGTQVSPVAVIGMGSTSHNDSRTHSHAHTHTLRAYNFTKSGTGGASVGLLGSVICECE